MRLLILITVIASCFAGYSQENGRQQILIFRNTGEVNLLFSDEIKSIECSSEDKDGNICDHVVSQRFILADTVLIVPIAEIDSVAFGERNKILPKSTARRLDEQDFEFITKVDDNTIVYKSNTPATLLPRTNDKIYYDGFNELFPVGLCAQITSVQQLDDYVNVVFKDVEPAEVFDEYFVAGEFDSLDPSPVLSRAADLNQSFKFDRTLSVNNISVAASGEVGLKVKLVSNVLIGYYHADFSIYAKTGWDMKIKSENSGKIEKETMPQTLFFGTIGGVIQPRLQISGFVDFSAEMGIAYAMERTADISFSWTKRKDEVTIIGPIFNNPNNAKNEAKLEAYLKGSLHLGIKPMVTIGVLFDRVGTGVDFKIGPEFSADFNLGMIQNLSKEFNHEYYAKAKLKVTMLRIDFETYTYNAKNFYLFGDKEKHSLPFKGSWSFFDKTFNLFPDFSTRAIPAQLSVPVGGPSKPTLGITAAATTSTSIEYPIHAGFEMVDTVRLITLDQVFLEKFIKADYTDLQGIDTEFDIPQSNMENTAVRPIFKYNGYTIKGATAGISDDIFYSPVITLMSHKGMYVVSGQPVVSQHNYDERTFIEGNYIPIPGNPQPFNRSITFSSGVSINRDITSGTYNNGERNIDLIFIDESTGTYNGEKFSYKINTPQIGDVTMYFTGDRVLIFTIIEVDDAFVKIQFKNSNEIIILER